MHKIVYALVGLVTGAALTGAIGASWAQSTTMQTMPMAADETDIPTKDMTGMHQHPARPVSLDLPIPKVTHLVFPDAMHGYYAQILPKYFQFTPAKINRDVQDNEGHAHIYVNGNKIARVYSQCFHLPSALFQPGINLVSVTLNANDHSEWSVADKFNRINRACHQTGRIKLALYLA